HRFLHDFADLAGFGEAFAAAHAACFDEDDVAADGSPDQTDGNARLLDALVDFPFGAEFWNAEEFANDFRSDNHLFRLTFRDAPSLFPRDGPDFALEIAYAGFASKAVNDFLQTGISELNLLTDFQSVFGGLLWDQVLVRDMEFLFSGVAWKFDD